MSRKPDYRVRALNKRTDERGTLGAAWKNKDGSITVVFDPFAAVPVSKDVIITMFVMEDDLRD